MKILTKERKVLFVITVSGIFYNIGMIMGPWFEGQLVQRLLDIMNGNRTFQDMLKLAILYVLVILLVQGFRFFKRLYVRKFANHLNRDMKQQLYENMIHRSRQMLQEEGAGSLMTKALTDVDACVEGIRKFTTEIFDTGVVMLAYLAMLLYYDWRLTLLSLIFPPLAYLIAERLKKVVAQNAQAYKKSAGELNTATMDRIHNTLTYRVYGQEKHIGSLYEEKLKDYEKRAIAANIWENAMPPIYQIISTLSVAFILWFGGKNVLGQGWTAWNIAAFTTFLSCFMKLALKSSRAAKLFNAIQKARVSWERMKPYMNTAAGKQNTDKTDTTDHSYEIARELVLQRVSFHYPETNHDILSELSFTVPKGQILGVTGPVASGKTTFGRIFLCEEPHEGNILLDGRELTGMETAYLGHQPELLSTTIEENILLGKEGDVLPYLQAVCMEEDLRSMPEGIKTHIGSSGVRLSGGQQARIALARTLFHKKPLVVLDDPFSAVDPETEQRIMKQIRPLLADSIVILLSHRLTLFPCMDQVLWIGEKKPLPHQELILQNAAYARLYETQLLQKGGKQE